ncbi:ABC transporter substrate-binding protein, partial [Ferrimicrobium sp.]
MTLAACGSSSSSSTTSTSSAPSAITIGTTYAGSGTYATSSIPELDGLKFWMTQENKKGGVYVGAYKKRIPVKLVDYNDLSSASTAATLYNQLITQDKVNILVADFGSVLTAPAVSL